MTLSPDDTEQQAFRVYEDAPMPDGDALLLLDDTVCLELAGLADDWHDEGRRGLVALLTETTSCSVRLAIARAGSRLHDSDYQVWRDLHASLRDSHIELRPLRALPAA